MEEVTMKRKTVAILMILTFLVMSLSACSKSKSVQNVKDGSDNTVTDRKEKTETAATMGRYMEKEVELPKLEGNEAIAKILQNNEKKFEIYTINHGSTGYEYYCYREAENMSWEKSKPKWLNSSELTDINMVLTDVCIGMDGCYYAAFNYYGEIVKPIIFRADNQETAQRIDIEQFEDPNQNKNGKKHYPIIEKIDVLQNGSIVLQDMLSDNTLLILDAKGKKIDEVITSPSATFIVYDNSVITMNEEGKIIFYNTETKSIAKTIEYNSNNNGNNDNKGDNKIKDTNTKQDNKDANEDKDTNKNNDKKEKNNNKKINFYKYDNYNYFKDGKKDGEYGNIKIFKKQ
jgi:hypothetical protein